MEELAVTVKEIGNDCDTAVCGEGKDSEMIEEERIWNVIGSESSCPSKATSSTLISRTLKLYKDAITIYNHSYLQ